MSGDPAAAFATFEQIAAIAERFDDVTSYAEPARSRAVVDRDVGLATALPLLDEAMAAVIAGETRRSCPASSTAR